MCCWLLCCRPRRALQPLSQQHPPLSSTTRLLTKSQKAQKAKAGAQVPDEVVAVGERRGKPRLDSGNIFDANTHAPLKAAARLPLQTHTFSALDAGRRWYSSRLCWQHPRWYKPLCVRATLFWWRTSPWRFSRDSPSLRGRGLGGRRGPPAGAAASLERFVFTQPASGSAGGTGDAGAGCLPHRCVPPSLSPHGDCCGGGTRAAAGVINYD